MLGILHLGLDALTCIIELFSIYENRSMHRYFDEHEHFMILIGASLRAARSRRPPLPEILLWTTTSLHPSESQTSECSDLLSRSRATCLIVAQRQPGKLNDSNHRSQPQQRQPNATGANARPTWQSKLNLIVP